MRLLTILGLICTLSLICMPARAERYPHRPFLTGEAFLALPQSERLRARDLLARALSLWEPMGAAPYGERCRQKHAELGAAIAPAGTEIRSGRPPT